MLPVAVEVGAFSSLAGSSLLDGVDMGAVSVLVVAGGGVMLALVGWGEDALTAAKYR